MLLLLARDGAGAAGRRTLESPPTSLLPFQVYPAHARTRENVGRVATEGGTVPARPPTTGHYIVSATLTMRSNRDGMQASAGRSFPACVFAGAREGRQEPCGAADGGGASAPERPDPGSFIWPPVHISCRHALRHDRGRRARFGGAAGPVPRALRVPRHDDDRR